jgi:hypothetical protein
MSMTKPGVGKVWGGSARLVDPISQIVDAPECC